MATLPEPIIDSSISTTRSSTKPDFVDPIHVSDNCIDTYPEVPHTNAVTLGPTVWETTLFSRATVTKDPEGWASAREWEKYRALITELYPKLILKEIMAEMASEHNFKAT